MFDVGRYRQGSNAAIKYFKRCLFHLRLTLHEPLTFVIGDVGIQNVSLRYTLVWGLRNLMIYMAQALGLTNVTGSLGYVRRQVIAT